MQCKFLEHGISIGNNGVVKPCCVFQYSPEYSKKYHINQLDVEQWQNSEDIVSLKNTLANDEWPKECIRCQNIESRGRGDSIRLNGENAYGNYQNKDITLEFRPGNVCNFACQTCWPASSTRVLKYYKQAELNYRESPQSNWNLNSIHAVKHRLKDIVLLGGEPFYDPKCLEFLQWVKDEKLTTNLTIFTNGSVIDREFLQNFPNQITLVFSLDAIGKPAEYIRVGTVWSKVKENYEFAKSLSNVNVRVNITVSPYNYFYYSELVEWLCSDWPEVVSFGIAQFGDHLDTHTDESVIPLKFREPIIKKLEQTINQLATSKIEEMQKINAINAVKSNIQKLKELPFDPTKHYEFKNFVSKMDAVKKLKIDDYCPEVSEFINYRINDHIITTCLS